MKPKEKFRLSHTLSVGLKFFFISCTTGEISEQVVEEIVKKRNNKYDYLFDVVKFNNHPFNFRTDIFEDDLNIVVDENRIFNSIKSSLPFDNFVAFTDLKKAEDLLYREILPNLLKEKMKIADKIADDYSIVLNEIAELEMKLEKCELVPRV